MEGLGRVLNVVPTADAAWVSLRHAAAVTFIGVGADTYTLDQATDSSGTGNANLTVITHHYYSSGAVGQTAWARSPASGELASAVDNIVTTDAMIALHVSANSLDDGFSHVRCSSTSSGLVVAILHDLNMQRSPEYLPVPVSNA
jgi:hypothetical protein